MQVGIYSIGDIRTDPVTLRAPSARERLQGMAAATQTPTVAQPASPSATPQTLQPFTISHPTPAHARQCASARPTVDLRRGQCSPASSPSD
jgi:hypothetical protein